MDIKTLNRANEINERLKQLDNEERSLKRIVPYLEQNIENGKHGNYGRTIYGKFVEFFRKKDNEIGVTEFKAYQIELTPNDIVAMLKVRDEEFKRLRAELEEL